VASQGLAKAKTNPKHHYQRRFIKAVLAEFPPTCCLAQALNLWRATNSIVFAKRPSDKPK
jgi:hypothetical protein